MKKRKFYIFLLTLALITAMLPDMQANAEDEISLNKKNLTLYVGNTYQLEVSGIEEEDENYYNMYFQSSDSSVVTTDWNGLLRAMSVGTAVITVYVEGGSLECKVKVMENTYNISEESLTVYTEEAVALTMSGGKRVKSYDYMVFDQEYNYDASWYFFVEEDGKGNFTITGTEPGNYKVYLIANAVDGRSYSVACSLLIEPCGLEKNGLAVAVGKKKTISLTNASEVKYVSQDPDIASVSTKGVITGKSEGSTSIVVTYNTPYGETKEEYCHVDVTLPEYVKFEGNMIAGEYYYPQVEGISYYSEIHPSSNREKTVSVNYGAFYALEAGTATLTVEVDGISFKQKIEVIDPKLSQENMFLAKGKTKYLKVTGAEEDSVFTFKSSDSSVAKISKTGKVTAKGEGVALITVTVDGYELYCSLYVGSGKGITAVQKGEEVLGAAYSQDRRMQEGYYDCSSFVWRSYNAAGVKLGGFDYAPTAAELGKKLESQGKVIAYEALPASELKPGDIIFYRGGGNGRYMNIDHVALYYGPNLYQVWDSEIYNDGAIIHASGNVHIRNYSSYRSWEIAMIARPIS